MKSEQSKQVLKIAKEILVGDYIMLKDQPCAVTETLHSKPGKHVMKARISGENLINQRKIEDIMKFSEMVKLISPQFLEFEVLDIDSDDMVSVLDQNSKLKEIKLQDSDQLKRNFLEQFELCSKEEIKFIAKVVKLDNEQKIIGFGH